MRLLAAFVCFLAFRLVHVFRRFDGGNLLLPPLRPLIAHADSEQRKLNQITNKNNSEKIKLTHYREKIKMNGSAPKHAGGKRKKAKRVHELKML